MLNMPAQLVLSNGNVSYVVGYYTNGFAIINAGNCFNDHRTTRLLYFVRVFEV